MGQLLHELANWLIGLVEHWGYAGIFTMMFIESSFVPFPSEAAMIPAGYLASQGRMSAGLAILAGVGGSLGGAFLNYELALHGGLPILKRFGRYFLITEGAIDKAESYFDSHGEITTFVCRLIPAIRQLISIPAGLARMNLPRFFLYTALGSGLWSTILVAVGYLAGEHEDKWRPLLEETTDWVLLAMLVLVIGYAALHRMRNRDTGDE